MRLGAGEGALGGETGPLLTPPLSTVGWLTVGRLAKPKKVETLKIKPLKQNKKNLLKRVFYDGTYNATDLATI